MRRSGSKFSGFYSLPLTEIAAIMEGKTGDVKHGGATMKHCVAKWIGFQFTSHTMNPSCAREWASTVKIFANSSIRGTAAGHRVLGLRWSAVVIA
jgi:hypothetical protein